MVLSRHVTGKKWSSGFSKIQLGKHLAPPEEREPISTHLSVNTWVSETPAGAAGNQMA